MKQRLIWFLSLALAVAASAPAQPVAINEIMYKPLSLNVAEEWIELHNPGATAVDLQGWRFSEGVSFAFSNASLPPGGYLVVAADLAAFKARYTNVENVVGGWTNFLNNNGEDIVLVDAAGNQIDRVRYAPDGDWAVRRWSPVASAGQKGWEWYAEHDGLGKSIELINPALPHDQGQNWASSQPAGGTPGAPNSVAAANSAPLIQAVQHLPSIPKSGQAVTISARVVDEQADGNTVQVWWRMLTNAFVATPMVDDGEHNDGLPNDGIFAAILPSQANLAVVEFYVQATDAQGLSRTWPAPALNAQGAPVQTANALYQVDDSVYTGNQPVFRIVMTEAERVELENIMNNASSSDAARNATFISTEGTGTQVRYLAHVRNRGAGSRGSTPHNRRVEFTQDRPWNGVAAVNLNSQYTHSQMAGSALATHAGLVTEQHRPIQIRLNGLNPAASGSRQYGSYIHQEARGSEFVQNHFPQDPNGNLYAAINGNHEANLTYLGTNSASYAQKGYYKQSNSSENDWSDLIQLADVLNNTPDTNYANAVRQVVNVDEWMLYFAVFTLTLNRETSLATGVGDDFALYRGLNDPRFALVGHDWDTILNIGASGGWTDSIFRMVPAIIGATNYNLNAVVLNRLMTHPEFVPLYYQQLKRLCDTTFSAEQLNPLLDQVLGDWVPQDVINNMKTFAANRRAYVASQIPLQLTVATSLGQTNGYCQTTNATITLNGVANAIDTRSVKVNGVTANWVAWRAAWNISGLPVPPGLNRVLVQAFDAQGKEIDRKTIDIWHDDGSVQNVGGAIAADTTWQATDGPFNITADLVINSGATLTIQPGTTIYMDPEVNITVAIGGRLLAEGTPAAPIRFTRAPENNGNWGNLTVNGADGSPETRIAYALFEFNEVNPGTPCLRVSGGTVFLDHVTFSNTAAPYLHVDGASFVVQDCVFPSATDSFELVHGTGGIKSGGRGIFLRNYFGAAIGYSDVIDFTGGNRPGGPIAQFINNVFAGSGDDHLDLDGTDAWVQGNIFMHAHKNGSPDTASAVSGGADNADTSEVTIIGNLFYDCDQAAMAKQGNFYTFLYNTVVHQSHQGGLDSEGGVVCLADEGTVEGLGMYLEGNILFDIEQLVRNAGTATVTFTNNLMPLAWAGPGGNNSAADPCLTYVPQLSETYFGNWETAQVMWKWFTSHGEAKGVGGAVGRGVTISSERESVMGQTVVMRRIGINRIGGSIPAAGWPEGSGYTHYQWRLDDGAWSAETPIAAPIELTGLTDFPQTLEVVGKNDAGLYQNDPVLGNSARTTTLRVIKFNEDTNNYPPVKPSVAINEVLARNSTTLTNNGTTPDLIELYNYGSAPVDLSGMGLTDDAGDPYRFMFPPGTTLDAGAYLVLCADTDSGGPFMHAGFAFDAAGDSLYLYDRAGGEDALLDSVIFGAQIPDYSIGRTGDVFWRLCQPTFGRANIKQPLGNREALLINEWLASARSEYSADFIELYNPQALPVALDGLFLTDNPRGWPDRHEIARSSFISAHGYQVFLADGNTSAGPDHLSFQLSSQQGELALLTKPNFERLDWIYYGPQTPDISQGRMPNGGAAFAFFSPPTPGGANPERVNVEVADVATPLIGLTNQLWYYNISNQDLGAAWRQPDFPDEQQWPSGYAFFGYENPASLYPYPFQTLIPSPNNGGPTVAYFRAHFNWSGPDTDVALVSTNYIDDGIIYYLNGYEVARVRVDPNVTSTTAEGVAEILVLTNVHLVAGDNVLAVKLFQSAANSSDDVFGMALSAVRKTTNYLFRSVVLNEVMANNLAYPVAGGTNATDWVELYNPTTNLVDLAGLSLSDDPANPTRWVFPAGATVEPGAFLVVRFDPNAPPSADAAGALNTGFGLRAEGDKLHLFDRQEDGGELLDALSFGLQAADWSIGRAPNGIGAWRLNLPTPGAGNVPAALGHNAALKINEWLANPSGNDNDFFELYNPEPQPVELGGLYLTDNLTRWDAHQIPPLSFIGVGERAYAKFIADGNAGRGADHVGFGLAAGGEAIGLFASSGQRLDAVAFSPQQNGVSEGRFPDGSPNITRFPGTSTPGASNLRTLAGVVINEVLTHTDPPQEDAIELYNPTLESMDISGWWLTDQSAEPRKFRIPGGTVIPPLGYVVFYEYQFNPNPGFDPGFALNSAQGDQVYLYTADAFGNLTGYRAGVQFGAAFNGVSFGRHETSVGVDFTALSQPSFGVDNPANASQFRAGAGAPNAYPRVGPVVINEVMYHPPVPAANVGGGFEFIELKNLSPDSAPLFDPAAPTNTWRLRDAVDFDFPPDITLVPGGLLLVVGFDPNTNTAALVEFVNYYALESDVVILGPYRGRLGNGTENVELYQPDSPMPPGAVNEGFVPYVLADKVKYSDQAPWPAAADGNSNTSGTGVSLQRRNAAQYGNDPANWLAGIPTPGAETGAALLAPPEITAQPQNQSVPPGSSVTFSVTAAGAEPLRYQWRRDGVDLAGATNAELALENVQLAQGGRYTARVFNAAGTELSAPAVLTVEAAPVIVRDPQNAAASFGGSVTFTVTARGVPPLTYQWRFNDVDLLNETNAALVISNVQAENEGDYSVLVGNAYGSAASAPARLLATDVPVILSQPSGTNIFIGTNVTFRVVAVGAPPLRYQWRLNDVDIDGATNATYAIPGAQLGQSGVYRVLVANDAGSVLSDEAVLFVMVPPVVNITATTAAAAESGLKRGVFRITRTGFRTLPLSVYVAVGGTATPGGDYAPIASPVVIPADANFVEVTVEPVDDSLPEMTETVALTLEARPEYNLGASTSATVAITDDDNRPPTIALTAPADGSRLLFGTNIIISAEASDNEGSVVSVEFFDGGTRLGEVTAPPFDLVWAGALPGTHVLTAIATDDLGLRTISAPVAVLVVTPGFADLFVNRGMLFGYTNTVLGTNTTYTKEPGEPRHSHSGTGTGNRSAWITWIAPETATVTMDTLGSGFDTLLVVYTNRVPGSQTVSNLVKVASNDDADMSTFQSRLSFTAIAGIAYHIVVDGYAANVSGTIVFHLNEVTLKPVITAHPQNQMVIPGEAAAFAVAVTGPEPLRYQWRVNGADILDATNAALLIAETRMEDLGVYTVVISNNAGTTSSQPAQLSFHLPPVITVGLTNQVADPGASVLLAVEAAGTGTLRYQWLLDGMLLDGQTNSTLLLEHVQHTNGGLYQISVDNGAGPASSQAELVVRPVFAGLQWTTNSLLSLTFRGTPGKAYSVLGTTNFIDWTELETVTNSAVEMEWLDQGAAESPRRVYRLRLAP